MNGNRQVFEVVRIEMSKQSEESCHVHGDGLHRLRHSSRGCGERHICYGRGCSDDFARC